MKVKIFKRDNISKYVYNKNTIVIEDGKLVSSDIDYSHKFWENVNPLTKQIFEDFKEIVIPKEVYTSNYDLIRYWMYDIKYLDCYSKSLGFYVSTKFSDPKKPVNNYISDIVMFKRMVTGEISTINQICLLNNNITVFYDTKDNLHQFSIQSYKKERNISVIIKDYFVTENNIDVQQFNEMAFLIDLATIKFSRLFVTEEIFTKNVSFWKFYFNIFSSNKYRYIEDNGKTITIFPKISERYFIDNIVLSNSGSWRTHRLDDSSTIRNLNLNEII